MSEALRAFGFQEQMFVLLVLSFPFPSSNSFLFSLSRHLRVSRPDCVCLDLDMRNEV